MTTEAEAGAPTDARAGDTTIPSPPGAVDGLTGLPVRSALERELLDASARAEKDGTAVGLVILGIDHFSVVNYRLGYCGGDVVLRRMAERLQDEVDPVDVLARLAGDEFVVLVRNVRHQGDLRALAARLMRCLRRPFELAEGEEVTATVSVGVAVSDGAGTHGDLLREADLALHRAKETGRDRVVVFDAEMRASAEGAVQAEKRLRRALRQGSLRMYLQPVVDLATGRRVAAEALVRIQDPVLGVIAPGEFMLVAEDRGLVSEIDRWGIDQAAVLLSRDLAPAVAVNVSARTLERLDVPGRVAAALHDRGLEPRRLHVEITESSLLHGNLHVAGAIQALRAYGCLVSIDDFGTGYSSMTYLQAYEVDQLKIDRSFVARLGQGAAADSVVQTVITLAHAHGLTVVAEGVETSAQAGTLLDMGCDNGQGWWFGRPEAVG